MIGKNEPSRKDVRTDGAVTGSGAVGLPGATRTPDTQFRKLLLYPSELQGEMQIQI